MYGVGGSEAQNCKLDTSWKKKLNAAFTNGNRWKEKEHEPEILIFKSNYGSVLCGHEETA